MYRGKILLTKTEVISKSLFCPTYNFMLSLNEGDANTDLEH